MCVLGMARKCNNGEVRGFLFLLLLKSPGKKWNKAEIWAALMKALDLEKSGRRSLNRHSATLLAAELIKETNNQLWISRKMISSNFLERAEKEFDNCKVKKVEAFKEKFGDTALSNPELMTSWIYSVMPEKAWETYWGHRHQSGKATHFEILTDEVEYTLFTAMVDPVDLAITDSLKSDIRFNIVTARIRTAKFIPLLMLLLNEDLSREQRTKVKVLLDLMEKMQKKFNQDPDKD